MQNAVRRMPVRGSVMAAQPQSSKRRSSKIILSFTTKPERGLPDDLAQQLFLRLALAQPAGVVAVVLHFLAQQRHPQRIHRGVADAGAALAPAVLLLFPPGTLAVARPDISTQVRFRKQEEIEKGAAALREGDASVKVKMLTSCPSCLQGMHRYADDAGGVEPDYIVVELARHLLGENWLPDYVAKANSGGIERVLL